jgi:hypothetical protein
VVNKTGVDDVALYNLYEVAPLEVVQFRVMLQKLCALEDIVGGAGAVVTLTSVVLELPAKSMAVTPIT